MLHRIILIAMLAIFAAPETSSAQTSTASFQIVTDTLEEEQTVELHIAITDQNIAAAQVEIVILPNDETLYVQTLQLDDLESENLESLTFDGTTLKLNFGKHPIQDYQAIVTLTTDGNTTPVSLTITSNQ